MTRLDAILLIALAGTSAACGRTTSAPRPAPDAGAGWDGYPRVALGGAHSCSLDAQGRVRCWGDNASTLFKPPAESFKDLAVGYGDACGIRMDGTLHCWPENNNYPSVESIPAGLRFRKVSIGLGFACGIVTNGSLACWGEDSEGVTDPPKGQFADVSAGTKYVCALRSDGSAVCWGANVSGQSTPPEGSFIAISAGTHHTCGLRENGLVVCWGDSKLFDQFKEKLVRAIAVADHGTCVLNFDGTVECDSDPAVYTIQPPPGRFEQIDMGEYHGCGVRHDGSIACWGANSQGQATPPG